MAEKRPTSTVLSTEEIFSMLPSKLADKLMPFQKDGIRFAITKNGRCLIADEMGLGKTLQAISVAYYYRKEWPLLIIVPSSLRFCWVEELEKWIPDIHPKDIYLIQSGNDASGISDAKISITTYGLLCKTTSKVVLEALNSQNFQVIIVDESHYIRNQKTASCKAIVPLIKNANRRILLSGTPSLSRPVELYPQIDSLCPGQFGSWWTYTGRYCDARIEQFGQVRRRRVDGASNLEELQKRLSSKLMIRRLKADVLTQLPEKQRQRILFDLKDSELKKDIKKTFEELRPLLSKNQSKDGSIITPEDGSSKYLANNLIMKLFNMSGEAKIGPAREYVEMLCENKNLKFLVFAYHHAMMNGIQQSLLEKNIRFVRIDGETKSADRQMYVHQFQSDSEIKVAILSILAAGVGLTLTAASLVVFAEMYWTPGVLIQCEDRAHRIGQTSCVSIHYLVAKGTMDEWMWSAVNKKTIVTTTILDGKKQELEADDGHGYQINVLSNAEAYVKPENDSVDLSEMLSSQKPRDQMSILDFVSSSKKRKKSDQESQKKRKRPEINDDYDKQKSEEILEISDIEDIETENICQEYVYSESTCQVESDISDISLVKSKRRRNSVTPKIRVSLDEDDANLNSLKESVMEETSNHKTTPKSVKQKDNDKNLIEALVESDDEDFVDNGNIHCCKVKTRDKEHIRNGDSSQNVKNACSSSKHKQKSSRNCKKHSVISSHELHKERKISKKILISSGSSESIHCKDEICEIGNDVSISSSSDREDAKEWACLACTFLNHIELPYCEICSTPKKHKSGTKNTVKNCYHSDASVKSFDKSIEGESEHERYNSTISSEGSLPSGRGKVMNLINDMEYDKNVENLRTDQEYDGSDSLFSDVSDKESLGYQDINEYNDDSIAEDQDMQDEVTLSLGTVTNDESISSIITTPTKNSVNGNTTNDEMNELTVTGKSSSCINAFGNHNTPCGDTDILPKGGADVSEHENGHMEDLFDDDWEDDVLSQCHIETECSVQPEVRVVNLDELTVHNTFQYYCSKYTGRIYLFDEEGTSLNANFLTFDIEADNSDDLPDILHHPANMKLVQRFVREWNSLSETKRRLVIKQGQMFVSPLRAYEDVKSGKTHCIHRHRTKEDTAALSLSKADEIRGSVRVISKPDVQSNQKKVPDTGESASLLTKGVVQAVDKDGVPLCLNCFKPYSNNLLQKKTITNSENAWVTRFCSQPCMDNYWMKTNAQYCREKVYEAEHGKCQKCGFEAHAVFRQIRDTADVKRRAEILNNTKYCTLKPKQREQMVRHPTEGQFWHADHIKPVWEGGGECDIDNLRTLCVMCHMKVTAEQAKKRAHVRRLSSAAGAGDITAFFQPAT